MTTENLAYPDVNAPLRLVEEMSGYFARFPFVNRVLVFGSLARGEGDRWSDVDMLVVTNGGSSQHWQLFDDLRRRKPILHHHTFTPRVEPVGGNVLGIVFRDESVFHNLDLNFMSQAEFLLPNALARFGCAKELYVSNCHHLTNNEDTPYPMVEMDADERRIGLGIHWTKKAVKRVLRGESQFDDLVKTSTRLKEIMQEFPDDLPVSGRNICRLARIYIKIADQLLDNKTGARA